MKLCWRLLVLTIFLSTTGILGEMNHARAAEGDQPWVSKIVSIQGRVAVKRPGDNDWRPVRLDDTLFAGDQIRVDANSRAGIVLRNDAVLRLDQNTILTFTEIEEETTFIFRLLKGAANFFSRRPRSLKILTPFVNGVVEGTEFLVQVEEDRTRIDLFEGRLLAFNPHGEVQLTPGQGATALAGSAPQRRLLVKPRESVQWALYYPPVLALDPEKTPTALQDALTSAHQGRWIEALNNLEQIEEGRKDTQFHTFRAALYLHQGSIAEARNDLRQALKLAPDNSEALALQAVIAVVQNRREEALRLAQDAVGSNAGSAAAQLALSYARQAHFDLPGALQAAEAAVALAPENGTARARLAELRLSVGQLDQGLRTAQKAVTLYPNDSHAHSLLGFGYLTRIKTQKARRAFEKAIALDSAAPLPRMGLGLAKIRDGVLEDGRSEIEIAVGLDPLNALMRSYLGKAYFDEKRGPLDATQLEIAKTLDPNDPTPWFYDAVREQTLNRPGEAMMDLQESIKRNDNRAVYRSRLLLDEDLAARSAALGRIYIDLSFQEKALREGAKSLRADPANYSAHRLLADIYTSRPRHEIAQVSELLQSQLLQPLNLTPMLPQSSETTFVVSENPGPLNAAFNEFNPLFIRNRITIQLSGSIGNNGTRSNEVTLAGLYGRSSFSAGRFHYESEGFRPNNDLEKDAYNAFAQFALSPHTNIQFEYRKTEVTHGDLDLNFDPDDFEEIKEINREDKIPRFGFHYTPNVHHHFIGSLIFNNAEFQRHTENIPGSTPFGPIVVLGDRSDEADSYNAEGQYIFRSHSISAIIGAGYYEQDFLGRNTTSATSGPLILQPETTTHEDLEIWHSNAYAYLFFKLRSYMDVTLGIGGDSYNNGDLEVTQFNPKFGFNWYLTPSLSLRGAAFRTLKRSLVSNQTIEPAQIAGFTQFFDEVTATDSKRYGLGIDYQATSRLSIGAEATRYDNTHPRGTPVRNEKHREYHHLAYLYWLPLSQLSLSAEYRFDDYERDPLPVDVERPFKLRTHSVPLTLAYFHACGLFAKIRGTYYNQKAERYLPIIVLPIEERDNFTLLDLGIGYRLPKRYGIVSLSVTNALDTSFNYHDSNFLTPNEQDTEIKPVRQYILKATLQF